MWHLANIFFLPLPSAKETAEFLFAALSWLSFQGTPWKSPVCLAGCHSVVSQGQLRTSPQAPTLRPKDRLNVLYQELGYKRNSD